jgi:cell division protein FtsI (penicillin-binding protein 3)
MPPGPRKGAAHRRRALEKKLGGKRYFVWVKRQVTPDEVAAVKALDIKGVGFYDEAKRFYPESESLANLVGFVGVDSKGLEGLELQYDGLLKGKERKIGVHRDGMGRIIYARGLQPETVNDGNTLWLTIDRRIQHIAFQGLKKAVSDNRAQSGFVIISNPATGEILALTSYPSFDPNRGSYRHLAGHANMAITHNFEPGSVIKPCGCRGASRRSPSACPGASSARTRLHLPPGHHHDTRSTAGSR